MHPPPVNRHLHDADEYQQELNGKRIAQSTFVAISVASIVALCCLLTYVYRLQIRVARLESQVSVSDGAVEKEVARIKELSAMMANSNRHVMKSMRAELDKAKQDVQASFGDSRVSAEEHVQKLSHQLKAEEQRQREMHDLVQKEIADTRQAAASAAASTEAHLTDVRAEVGSVRREVVETQSNLNKAVFDLRRVVGDMGVLSGHIATNQRELEMLRAVGDRTYVQFRLPKGREPRVVNGVALTLKKTDPHSRKFTLELVADDVRVQKRDKTMNEPVQFYVGNGRQPYELVVNAISKNEVAGYLSTPKADSLPATKGTW